MGSPAVQLCRQARRNGLVSPWDGAPGLGVMLVSDLHRGIGASLFQVPEFATWANTVADVMLYE